MSVIIKDMEMPKTCSQCEIWSKCWDERPFWFERLEYCPLMEMADRKTESNSEIPNNCKDLQDWKDQMWTEAMRSCGFNVDGYRKGQPKTEPQTD